MPSTPKRHKDGTHRAVSPSQTIKKAKVHLAKMGISRVANVTGLDRLGIPVFNAYRPNSRSLSVSQGKGLTPEAAKASAIMEAIEGFHAEEIDLPLKSACYNSFANEFPLIDIEALPFLADREFDPAKPILWIEGVDLISSNSVWAPYELVHTDYTINGPVTAGCFVASTNGLASGNIKIEADIHGICEVIERDAHTLWHLLPNAYKSESRVDISSVTAPSSQVLIDVLRSRGMSVGLWNMTNDIGIATFYCLVIDDEKGGHSGAGAGTHIDAEVALSRALTEAAQVRTNYITGARDDLEREEYERRGIAQKLHIAQGLFEAQPTKSIDFSTIQSHRFDTFEEDLDWLLNRLKSVGVKQVISVDLTKTGIEIPVARIIIPGLEGPHDHRDYRRGRRALSQFARVSQ